MSTSGNTPGQFERGKRNLRRSSKKTINKLKKKRKNSEHWITEKPTEALTDILTERCKILQFDESLTKVAAVLIPKEVVAQHLDRVREIAGLTTTRKLVGFLWLMTLEKLFCESSQTAFLKTATCHKEHFSILMAPERSQRVEHPTLRNTNRLDKSVRPCGQ